MTYFVLNLIFVAIALVGFLVQIARKRWRLYALTLLPMLLLTAIFDNAIIFSKIVAYDEAKISGILIGIAPIEDFAYTVAAVLVVPTVWWVLGKQSDKTTGREKK
jgi:hypothetical protein